MFRGCIVQKEHEVFRDFEFQQYGQLDAGALRNVFSQAMRLSLDVLVLDLDSSSGDAFLSAVHTYRVMRPKTRLIILVSGRLPGDKTITDLVAMGIYDIVGGDAIPELQRLLESPPATYAQAVRWTGREEELPVKQSKRGLLERLFKWKPAARKKDNKEFFAVSFAEDIETDAMPLQDKDMSSLAVLTDRNLLLSGNTQSLAAALKHQGWKVTFQVSDEYDIALADPDTYKTLPQNKPTIIIGAGIDLFFSSEQFSRESVIPVASDEAAIKLLQERFEENKTPLDQKIPRNQAKQKNGLVVGFYSGAQGWQGKTVLALNTAALLAADRNSVCVVDLDTDKAGLTMLAGWNENVLPPSDLWNSIQSSAQSIKGPGGVDMIPARLDCPGWSPLPAQINGLLGKLAKQYDYVVLDFGARVASPSTIAALRQCGIVFIVSTPFRGALSAVARFRGKEMAEIGGNKVRVIINRAGADGAMTPKDAAAILGFTGMFHTVPEDSAFVLAEEKALNCKSYVPPVLGKCGARKAVEKLARQIQESREGVA